LIQPLPDIRQWLKVPKELRFCVEQTFRQFP
jgi:hypothetical protein